MRHSHLNHRQQLVRAQENLGGSEVTFSRFFPRLIEDAHMVLATAEAPAPEVMEQYRALADRVRAAQDGDREALGSLFEQFERTVYSVILRRLGNKDAALDLQQEVFRHVTRRLPQLREPERFAGWLRQVANRMAINAATRGGPLQCTCLEKIEEPSVRESLETQMDESERATLLRIIMQKLKPDDAQCLVLFYLEGWRLKEIAAFLNIPIGTVKRRIHTARKRLRALIEGASNSVRNVLMPA
jgi:RNA polymerase sigma-70 factor, ECF subfamily